jgi:cytochrome c oxidase cbb3-type subunit IV
MDTNDLRIFVTLFGLCLFIVLVVWQWLPARLAEHNAAAQLPFADDLPAATAAASRGAHHE